MATRRSIRELRPGDKVMVVRCYYSHHRSSSPDAYPNCFFCSRIMKVGRVVALPTNPTLGNPIKIQWGGDEPLWVEPFFHLVKCEEDSA